MSAPARPVLLTGATGFVGALVLDRLLRAGHEVACLVRARDEGEASARLRAVLARIGAAPGARARAVPGDVTMPGLGLGHRGAALAAELGTVVHAAASVAFDLPLAQARAINVEGTRELLGLAARAPGLERVVHVSTAYVAGDRAGLVAEDDPGHGPFRNAYEQSKREAEALVRASGLPATVVRPSIVAGERGTGWTASFNVIYVPVRAFAAGALPVLPGRRRSPVDVISADYVADAVAALAFHPAAQGRTLHLVAGERDCTVRDVVALAARRFGRRAPVILAPSLYGRAVHPLALRRAAGPAQRQLRRSECYFPYFAMRQRFDDAGARALLAPLGIAASPLHGYFDALMDFAQAAAWGRRPLSRPEAAELAAAPPDVRRARLRPARTAAPARAR